MKYIFNRPDVVKTSSKSRIEVDGSLEPTRARVGEGGGVWWKNFSPKIVANNEIVRVL